VDRMSVDSLWQSFWQSFWQSLVQFDRQLFEVINVGWTNSVFEFIFPLITDLHKEPVFLVFVLFSLAFWVWRQGARALKWILVLILSVGFADLFAYRVIKKSVDRARPPYSGVTYELRTNSHSGDSFPSNHATNMFAAATALSGAAPSLAPVFFGVAFLVAYSRVYVGVHFPLDVTAGAIIGVLIAALVRRLFRKWLRSDARSSRVQSSGRSS
jgi:membrane-associated phospholipid phosphatase